jgi:hypothetical protein
MGTRQFARYVLIHGHLNAGVVADNFNDVFRQRARLILCDALDVKNDRLKRGQVARLLNYVRVR